MQQPATRGASSRVDADTQSVTARRLATRANVYIYMRAV